MSRLNYTNDQQIIEDAARLLIEAHLYWRGSGNGMPSKDNNFVQGNIYCALMDHFVDRAIWDELTEDERESTRSYYGEMAEQLFNVAADEADRKWFEALLVLGLA